MYARWASRFMKDMDEIPGWIGVICIPLVTSTSWVLMTSTSTATFYMLLYWTSIGLYPLSLEEHFLVAVFAAWLYFAAYKGTWDCILCCNGPRLAQCGPPYRYSADLYHPPLPALSPHDLV
ncbi:unnamed protein product [Polarella glacialis]|uniref:Uncharacterized protein n=1 Tax=Polarella glacialis TaxID=89957 RepID=A0A813E2P5_POLGL|nr:unnamed protein product [Polarella glacialis]